MFNFLKKKPVFKVKAEHKIIPAFVCDGVQYYEFDDAFNIPAERCYCAMSFYEEVSMKCTREFLQTHVTAVNNVFNNPKQINLPKLMELNKQLQERLDMIFDYKIALKLASVVYFDDTENPYSYDFGYGLKKIAKWTKDKGALDFFLSQPMKKLVPFLNSTDIDLAAYMKVQDQVNQDHLKSISEMLSSNDKMKDFYKTLELQNTAI